MIPGGAGETEGSENIAAGVRAAIARGRQMPGGGPVFLGPNSLGAISRPGGYDTLFIPQSRLDKRWSAPGRPCRARLAKRRVHREPHEQSRGARSEDRDLARQSVRPDRRGRRARDRAARRHRRHRRLRRGLQRSGRTRACCTTSRPRRSAGKHVVFYKAGRTESGRSAAAGHTAAVAGDYDVCQAAAAQAGALVADTFKEFEQMLELCTALHGKTVNGVRIGAVSNAGFECVGIADAIRGQRYRVQMADAAASRARETGRRHDERRAVAARERAQSARPDADGERGRLRRRDSYPARQRMRSMP